MAPEFTADDALRFLQGRGLLEDKSASVEELGGGVSSHVFLVSAAGRRFIVKRPLPKFRVADEWLVDMDRVRVEADFLKLVGGRLPRNSVPDLVAFDDPNQILVTAAAPPSFRPWKERLVKGDADTQVASSVGELLAKIHRIGLDEPPLRSSFDRPRLFHQQRIEPYLRTLVGRHPDRADPLNEVIAHLEHDRTTLIHGDYSPKNILTDGRGIMLVDHEVATWNDPLFDVCFLLNHLALKAVHRPREADRFHECMHAFLDRYQAQAPTPARVRLSAPIHLLPALMLARVDGKSPVEYLSEDARREVRQTARRQLAYPAHSTKEYVARLAA